MSNIYGMIGAVLAGLVIPIIVGIVLWILAIIGEYKAFQKTGQEGYPALIPLLDEYIMGQFSGARNNAKVVLLMKVFGSFLCFIPVVGLIAYIVIVLIFEIKLKNAVAKSFGYGTGMTVLLILIPTIAWIVIGFGGNQYVGPSVQD